jgi:small basic protein (TIGR04137 family)
MSVDRSLKLKGALVRHRNVLTRTERIERLKEEERWQEGDSLFGLVKVAHRKVSVGKKKEAKAEGEAAVLDATATAAAPGAAGAGAPAAGKAAAPAKAAPATKVAPAKAAPAAKSTGQGKPGGGGGRR